MCLWIFILKRLIAKWWIWNYIWSIFKQREANHISDSSTSRNIIRKFYIMITFVVDSNRFIDWLIDWLVDSLIDSLIDWLIDSLIDWLIDWSFFLLLKEYIVGSAGGLPVVSALPWHGQVRRPRPCAPELRAAAVCAAVAASGRGVFRLRPGRMERGARLQEGKTE